MSGTGDPEIVPTLPVAPAPARIVRTPTLPNRRSTLRRGRLIFTGVAAASAAAILAAGCGGAGDGGLDEGLEATGVSAVLEYEELRGELADLVEEDALVTHTALAEEEDAAITVRVGTSFTCSPQELGGLVFDCRGGMIWEFPDGTEKDAPVDNVTFCEETGCYYDDGMEPPLRVGYTQTQLS